MTRGPSVQRIERLHVLDGASDALAVVDELSRSITDARKRPGRRGHSPDPASGGPGRSLAARHGWRGSETESDRKPERSVVSDAS